MKLKWIKWLLVLEMLGMLSSSIHAENIQLTYDGKKHTYSEKPIHLYIDEQEIETKVMPPVRINGCTFVPAKEVFSYTGAEVEWRSEEKSIYIFKGNMLMVLKINQDSAWVNGENKKMDIPPKMINNKVMIPLRFVGETLGYQVSWHKEDSSVRILTGGLAAQENTDEVDASDVFNWGEDEHASDNNTEYGNISSNTTNSANSNIGSSSELSSGNPVGIGENNSIVIGNTVDSNSVVNPVFPEQTYPSQDPNNSIINIDNPMVNVFNSENINYLWGEGTFVLKEMDQLQAYQVTCNEDAYHKQIIIDLNKDYSSYLQEGYFPIGDSNIDSLQVIHQMGSTRLLINTSTIKAVVVSESEGMLQMRVVTPSEKYSKIVVVDAGHGGHDSGTTAKGYKEKDFNLALSQQLVSVLEGDPEIKVYATRQDDTFVELEERSNFANEINPDLFISIHINSTDSNPNASGTETYYTKKSDTRNKTFADIVQKTLVDEFGTRNRGVKSNTFVVTRCTDAPAILIEIGFLTNESDLNMMNSPDFTTRYASAVYRSILEYYNSGYDY